MSRRCSRSSERAREARDPMSRIESVLREAKARRRAGLIAFLEAGDPDPDETPDLVAALAASGADLVELGVPFSDPIADGPAIQRASERSEEHTSELQSHHDLVCRLLLEKKK